MTVLHTARFVLSPLEPEDLEAWHALNVLPEVRRFLFDDVVWTLAETRERLLEVNLRQWREEGHGLFALRQSARGPLLGWAGFWYFHEPPVRELAYALHPGWRGRGAATEASRAVLRFGRDVHGDRAFRASTDAPNEASMRVLARLGFREERRAPGPRHETVHLVRDGTAGLDEGPSGNAGAA